jgi:hypothetical protein
LKLTIKNLGRIKDAEIDIKPLTVFIGENGTNKTWAAYTMHALLRSMTPQHASSQRISPAIDAADPLVQMLSALWDQASGERSQEHVRDVRPGEGAELGGNLDSEGVATVLAIEEASVLQAAVNLRVDPAELATTVANLRVSVLASAGRVLLTPTRQDGSSATVRVIPFGDKDDFLREVLSAALESFGGAFIFPAERKALSTYMMGARQAVPLPITDFLEWQRVALHAPERVDAWESNLLSSVLGGQLVRAGRGDPVLRFTASSTLVLPLHASHSLARAIGGLWTLLRFVANPGDFLIIDELEMNAHPHAQLQLTEFIALLVNKGLRVVFTTHSPYIVDHLNNLMEASGVPEKKKDALAKKFQLKTKEAFISPKDVAVHWFKPTDKLDPTSEVKVVPVVKDGLIDFTTFSEWTEWEGSLFNQVLRARGVDASRS